MPVARRFTAIRVRIRNAGAAFELACKVRDAGGAEWTAHRVSLQAGEDWRWVEFPASAWTAASWSQDANGKLDFPLDSFALIAFQVQKGLEYRLQISQIEIVRPDAPVATLSDLQLPEAMVAGQTYAASLRFRLDRPVQEDGEPCLTFRAETTRPSACRCPCRNRWHNSLPDGNNAWKPRSKHPASPSEAIIWWPCDSARPISAGPTAKPMDEHVAKVRIEPRRTESCTAA